MKAYAFKGALYCEDHGMDIMADRADQFKGPGPSRHDSNVWPQAVDNGGGEADSPQHCDKCHVHLENPLTDDGRAYVRQSLAPYASDEPGDYTLAAERAEQDERHVLALWARFYGDSL